MRSVETVKIPMYPGPVGNNFFSGKSHHIVVTKLGPEVRTCWIIFLVKGNLVYELKIY